ncbi:hypothetical protein CC2G_014667 [Coprinopsis cinerea AmutBmut pab1-1]|nr:hypothetical protein CC2G_014667 [Coprinopsis cinerea AmutBmut pab1-1]
MYRHRLPFFEGYPTEEDRDESTVPSAIASSFDGMDVTSGHVTLDSLLNLYHHQHDDSHNGQESFYQSSSRALPSTIARSLPYAPSGEPVQAVSESEANTGYHEVGPVQSGTQPQHLWTNQRQGNEAGLEAANQSAGLDVGFQDAIREADYSYPLPITPLTYLYPRGHPPSVASHDGYPHGPPSLNFNPEPHPAPHNSTPAPYRDRAFGPGAHYGAMGQTVPNPLNSGSTVASMPVTDPIGLPGPSRSQPPQQYSQHMPQQCSRLGDYSQSQPQPSQNPYPTPTSNIAPSNVTGLTSATAQSYSSNANAATVPAGLAEHGLFPPTAHPARGTQLGSVRRGGKTRTIWFSTEPLPPDMDKVQVEQVLGDTIVHQQSTEDQPSVKFVNHTPDELRLKFAKTEESPASSAPGPNPPIAPATLPASLPANLREELLDPKLLKRLGKVDPRSSAVIANIFQAFHDKLTQELNRSAPTSIQAEPLKEAKSILVSWGLQYILNGMLEGMIVSQEDLQTCLKKRLNRGDDVFGYICQAWRGIHSKASESRLRSESSPTNRRRRSTSTSRRSRPRSVSASGLQAARLGSSSNHSGTDDYTRYFSPETAREIEEHLLTGLSIFLTDYVTAPFIEGMVDHALRLLVDLSPELKRFFDSTAGFDITDLINVILNIALSGCYMHYYGTKPDGVGLPFIQTEYKPHPTAHESFQIVLCLRADKMVAKNREPYVLHFRSGGVIGLFTWMVRGIRSLISSSPNPVLERLAGQACDPPLEKDFMGRTLVLPIAVMSIALYGCFHFRSLTVTGRDVLENLQCRRILSRKMATAGGALKAFVKEDPFEYAELRRHLLHCVDIYTTPAPIPAPLDLGLTWTVDSAVHLNFGRPLLAHASHVALHEEIEVDNADGDSMSTTTAINDLSHNPHHYSSPIPHFDNRPSAQRHRLLEALRPAEPRPATQVRKRRRSNSL